jgi:hypothetical protein
VRDRARGERHVREQRREFALRARVLALLPEHPCRERESEVHRLAFPLDQ